MVQYVTTVVVSLGKLTAALSNHPFDWKGDGFSIVID